MNRVLAIARVITCKFMVCMGDGSVWMVGLIQGIINGMLMGKEDVVIVHEGFNERHDGGTGEVFLDQLETQTPDFEREAALKMLLRGQMRFAP